MAFLTLAALAVGCKPSWDTPAADSRQATARQLDQAERESQAASQAMNDYAYTQKAEFVATMQTQLAEINRDLDQLAARIEKADDEAKAEATRRLAVLRTQVAGLNTRLDDAKNATESTWSDVKAGFKQGYSELREGFNQARQWVSDKIAP